MVLPTYLPAHLQTMTGLMGWKHSWPTYRYVAACNAKNLINTVGAPVHGDPAGIDCHVLTVQVIVA
jgi:hypothetical protein